MGAHVVRSIADRRGLESAMPMGLPEAAAVRCGDAALCAAWFLRRARLALAMIAGIGEPGPCRCVGRARIAEKAHMDAENADSALCAFPDRRMLARERPTRRITMPRHSTKRPAAANAGNAPKPSGPWTREEEGVLIEMWMRNLSNEEISERIGRNPSAIAVKASRLALPRRNRHTDNPNARIRRCMRCGRDFHSFGPGNRICGPCKASPEYDSEPEYRCLYV